MTFETLTLETRGAIDILTLNRPQSLNALSAQMTAELNAYLDAKRADHDCRVIILRGEGRAFCAGLDLHESVIGKDPSVDDMLALQQSLSDIMIKMRRIPQPIIALVQGAACGGGFSLALASDVRYAGRTAKMNAAYIRIGLGGCDIGASYFLPRLVGASLASELLLTGNFIHADRALARGLVSDVVDDADLLETGLKLASDMLKTAPMGLRLTKDALGINIDAGSLEAAIALEDRQQVMMTGMPNQVEAMQAFLQKRDPSFS